LIAASCKAFTHDRYTFVQIAKFEGHKNNITHVGFHRAGKWMYTSSEDGTVKVWDMRCGLPRRPALQFAHALRCETPLIAVHRAKKYQRDFKHPGPVNAAALHPNQGEIIAGDTRGNVCVWDLGTAKLSTALRPEPDVPVQALSIAEDNSALAAATNSGTVYVWAPPGDAAGYTPVHQLQAHRSYVLSVKLSPDGTHMATCSADKTVKLWDAAHDFAPSGTLTGHSSWVWDANFTVDGQYLVTASSDKTAKLWEVATCECVHTYSGHSLGLQAAALADEMSPGEGGSRGVSMASAAASE